MANDTTNTTATFSIEYPADGYDATPTWAELYGTAFEDIDSLLADRLTEEGVEDAVDALLTGGDKVSLSYDDANDALQIDTSALDAEEVRDEAGSLLVGGSGINVAVDDGADTVTLSLASHASTHEKGGSDELTTFGDTTHDSVSTESADVSQTVSVGDTVDYDETYSQTVADGSSATLTAEFSDGSSFGGCKLYIVVQYSPQLSLTSAYQYDRLHVDIDESLYSTAVEAIGDGSAGNFQTQTSDFTLAVADPSTIEITYTNNNGSGKDNKVHFFVMDSVNFVSASMS